MSASEFIPTNEPGMGSVGTPNPFPDDDAFGLHPIGSPDAISGGSITPDEDEPLQSGRPTGVANADAALPAGAAAPMHSEATDGAEPQAVANTPEVAPAGPASNDHASHQASGGGAGARGAVADGAEAAPSAGAETAVPSAGGETQASGDADAPSPGASADGAAPAADGGEPASADGAAPAADGGEPVADTDASSASSVGETGHAEPAAEAVAPEHGGAVSTGNGSGEPRAAVGATAHSAEPNLLSVAHVQAGLIQAHATTEYMQSLTAIGQREQSLRGTFAQQRAAIRMVSATQVGLARSDAKATADRVRGRNGTVSQTIGQMIDGEVTRLSLGTQGAMARVSTASRAVSPAIRDAANNALPNANLDLRDAVEGQLANELYQRLVPPAHTAARKEAHDARDRDVERLGSARDGNIRQMRQAGDVLARQAAAQLPDVERSIVASGEKLAALFEHNARTQVAAIDAAERGAAAFFARARTQAHQILGAGKSTAATLTTAATAQSGTPGAGARFQTAASQAAPHFARRREQLVSSVEGVVQRATSTVAHGVNEFQGECAGHRAQALGNHAAIEGKLAGDIAGKVGQIRGEWAKDTDVAIISANSYAAAAEANRAQLIAQLPAKFGGIVRSAFSEARKSRLTRFGEGVWGAVSGLVVTIAKFVATALIIGFAPFAFGVAALLGKAGVLAGLVRDAAMAIVGMVQAFAERFKILFRTWDDWPWYGKVAGLWATTLVAVGDVVGLPSIFEGVTGRELISNRELSYDEQGAKTFGGGFAAIATLVPAKLQADKAARATAAREMGKELGELEGRAASRAETTAASTVDDAAAAAPESAPAATTASHLDDTVILQGTDIEIAALAKKITPEPGTVDVYVHGSVDDFIVHHNGSPVHLDHRRLATYIRKSGKNPDRVRLLSCSTGAHAKGAAQHFANKLGVKVVAPSDILHINRKTGKLTIGPSAENPSGSWIEFEPKTSEFRYSPWKEKPRSETRYERFKRERAELDDADDALDSPEADPDRVVDASVAVDEGAAKPGTRRTKPISDPHHKALGSPADEAFLDDIDDVDRATESVDGVPDRRAPARRSTEDVPDRGAPSDLDDGMHSVDADAEAVRQRQARAAASAPSRPARTPLAEHIPPSGPEFMEWFDSLTLEELDTLLKDKSTPGKQGAQKVIADHIRHPGHQHEWLMVKHMRQVKKWGISMRTVLDARTRTESAVGRGFRHGSRGSGAMHEALSEMIEASSTFWEFRQRLSAWADRELFPVHGPHGETPLGRYYLPEDLQVPAEGGGAYR